MELISRLTRAWQWKIEIRPAPLLAGVCVWVVLRLIPIDAARTVKAVLDVVLVATIGVGLVILTIILALPTRRRGRPDKTHKRGES